MSDLILCSSPKICVRVMNPSCSCYLPATTDQDPVLEITDDESLKVGADDADI